MIYTIARYISFITPYTILFALFTFLNGCGGAGTSGIADFNTLTVFSDGAGVASGKTSDGDEMLYIAPNIVADVKASNAATEYPEQIDITQYPIINIVNGYNIRQGTVTVAGLTGNVLIAEKIGGGKAQIAYLWDNTGEATFTYSRQLSGYPIGTFTYDGIFNAGSRSNSFAEIGTLTFTSNFENNTFNINGTTASTSLTGSGYIDKTNGRISSGNLNFVSPYGTNYSATTIGRFAKANATNVTGVFYTNDNNPDYAGSFSADR